MSLAKIKKFTDNRLTMNDAMDELLSKLDVAIDDMEQGRVQPIDDAWKENLRELDELKHSVQNASYEQKDPLLIFKLESVNLFDNMVNKINNNTISVLMRGQIPVQEPEQVREAAPEPQAPRQQYREEKQDLSDPHQQAAAEHDTREVKREPVRAEKTVGRNDPCPCGSGKKYKNCHGQNA